MLSGAFVCVGGETVLDVENTMSEMHALAVSAECVCISGLETLRCSSTTSNTALRAEIKIVQFKQGRLEGS